jgi:hypothetical protein
MPDRCRHSSRVVPLYALDPHQGRSSAEGWQKAPLESVPGGEPKHKSWTKGQSA